MAAFAGTAVLLMDFGVTHWVCCQAPQEREYSEDARATPGGGGGRGRQEGATGEAPGSWAGAELVSPGAPGRCWGPAGRAQEKGPGGRRTGCRWPGSASSATWGCGTWASYGPSGALSSCTLECWACLDCGCGPQDAGRGSLAVLTVVTTYFGCQATRARASRVSTPLHVYPSGASEEGCWLRGLLFQPLASFLGRCLPMDLPTAHSSAGHPVKSGEDAALLPEAPGQRPRQGC